MFATKFKVNGIYYHLGCKFYKCVKVSAASCTFVQLDVNIEDVTRKNDIYKCYKYSAKNSSSEWNLNHPKLKRLDRDGFVNMGAREYQPTILREYIRPLVFLSRSSNIASKKSLVNQVVNVSAFDGTVIEEQLVLPSRFPFRLNDRVYQCYTHLDSRHSVVRDNHHHFFEQNKLLEGEVIQYYDHTH